MLTDNAPRVSEPTEQAAPTAPDTAASDRRRSWVALAGSGVGAAALIAFVAMARVPIGAGWRQGRSLRVLEIWSLFTHELAVVAGAWLSPTLITAIVIVTLVGGVVLLGIALTVSDEPPEVCGD